MAKKIDLNGLDHFKEKENAMIASEYSSSKTYVVGDYCYHAGTLYCCTTAITTAENWTSGHWTAAKLAEDTSALKTAIMPNATSSDIGKTLVVNTVNDGKVESYSLEEVGIYGLSDTVKQALLQIASKTLYIDDNGGKYYNDLYSALYIPPEYEKVDYISSNVIGTLQPSNLQLAPYIKTDFPSVDTDIINYTVIIDYKIEYNYSACPFGGRNAKTSGNTTRGTVFTNEPANSQSSLIFGNTVDNANTIVTYLGMLPTNTRRLFELRKGSVYINNVFLADTGATSAIQLANYKWGLFCRNNNNSWATAQDGGGDLHPTIGRLYSFIIKNENDKDILNMIPCKRKTDNVYGMYDVVGHKFYISQGRTAFNGGNE